MDHVITKHTASPADLPPCGLTRADRIAMKMFASRPRWLTTVGLQGVLGIFFVGFPNATMRLLEVPDTVHTGVLFQLYGALLLHRTVMEQVVRNRGEAWLIRAYMVSTFPFGTVSAIVIGYASVQGYMNAYIGWIWVVLFAAEIAEFAFLLAWHALEVRATSASQVRLA
jgi:hypothetical protein